MRGYERAHRHTHLGMLVGFDHDGHIQGRYRDITRFTYEKSAGVILIGSKHRYLRQYEQGRHACGDKRASTTHLHYFRVAFLPPAAPLPGQLRASPDPPTGTSPDRLELPNKVEATVAP